MEFLKINEVTSIDELYSKVRNKLCSKKIFTNEEQEKAAYYTVRASILLSVLNSVWGGSTKPKGIEETFVEIKWYSDYKMLEGLIVRAVDMIDDVYTGKVKQSDLNKLLVAISATLENGVAITYADTKPNFRMFLLTQLELIKLIL